MFYITSVPSRPLMVVPYHKRVLKMVVLYHKCVLKALDRCSISYLCPQGH